MSCDLVTPVELVYALSLAAVVFGIGAGMFLYLPFAPKRDGLPPMGVVLIRTLFAMPLDWLLQNVPRLWPMLPAAIVGILVGFLANHYKQGRAR